MIKQLIWFTKFVRANMSFPYRKLKCTGCRKTYYLPEGLVDYICQCAKSNGERKTDDRQRLKYDDPQWNYLGINSDNHPKSDEEKKDEAFEENTPLDTYNSVQ